MGTNWTKKQSQAIETRGKTLLISAAAGSGKTATLTERIVQKLMDENNPASISKMLIVTFTRLSAADLKRKISAAISKKLIENPTSQHLSKQLVLLESAHICTIDSFYLDIVRSNFGRLSLPSNFRLADEGEMALLRKEVMDSIIEKHYDNNAENDDGFLYFVENFTSAKQSDTLSDIFLALENKLCSKTEGTGSILSFSNELIEESKYDFFESRQGKIIYNYLLNGVESYHKAMSRCCDIIAASEPASKAYLASFSYEKEFLANLLEILQNKNYTSAREFSLTFNKQRLGTLKKEFQTDEIISCKALRDEECSFIKSINEKYFSFEAEQIKETMLKTAEILRSLHSVLNEFEEAALEEKIKRKAFDFDDIRRFAYKLLTDENGDPSDIALSYREQFDEIYIDEYQDVDAMQDRIFTLISKPNNRFMVGDIKQSIYSFRGADTDVFAGYKKKFQSLDDA
jgi:ATP-dependent helicase/nuclease subunit A